jgi:hypothetical protein
VNCSLLSEVRRRGASLVSFVGRDFRYWWVVRPDRFERPTLWFEARCSIQLSYGRALRVYRVVSLASNSFLMPASDSSAPERVFVVMTRRMMPPRMPVSPACFDAFRLIR